MKHIILVALLTVLPLAKSLGQNSLIYGTISADLPYKYAYLYISGSKELISTSIIDKKFSFSLAKRDSLTMLSLSFNTELIKTFQELKESVDYEYPNRPRIVALEDTVEISLNDKTQDALVKGKKLNKAVDEMFFVIKTKKYSDFFESNSENPVSLVFLKTLVQGIINGSPFFSRVDCKLWFNKLSDELRNSKKGKEISEMFKQLKI